MLEVEKLEAEAASRDGAVHAAEAELVKSRATAERARNLLCEEVETTEAAHCEWVDTRRIHDELCQGLKAARSELGALVEAANLKRSDWRHKHMERLDTCLAA